MKKTDGHLGIEGDLEHTMKEELVMSELKLLYAEKRTSLSVLRTGIAILMLPLSVFTVLVATSRYYNILEPGTLAFAVPLIAISLLLIIFGGMLILRSLRSTRRCDEKISIIRKEDRLANDLLED